jgi:hypothetical protein
LEVEFRVQPATALVYAEGYASEVSNEQPRPLGAANEILLVDMSKYPTSELMVTFRAEGYQDLTRTFSLVNALRNKGVRATLPAAGEPPIELVPKSRDWKLLALVLTGLAASVGGALAYRASRGKVRDIASWVAEHTVPSEDGDPLVGNRLGDYWILERLGRGGMAMVYRVVRANEDADDEELALKVVHQHVAEDADFLARFRREVAISSELIHPHIVTVFDAGRSEGRHYMALELVKGNDLRSHLPEGGFPLDVAIGYLRPIFEAVAYAHRKGVVHRDLKPENVLVTEDRQIKLSDFGLARAHNFTTVTATGNIMGTPGYMAPEQIEGRPFHPATDQYALGVMTYELCTGQLPFDGEDVMQVIMKHLSAPAPAPSTVKPGLPQALDDLVTKMMAKSPSDRYSDVAEALAALGRVQH